MSPVPDFNNRNRTLFGLRTNANLVVRYDLFDRHIESVSPLDVDPADIKLAEVLAFQIPVYVTVAGVPLFPSTYEYAPLGVVNYHSLHPPREDIRLVREDDLDERTKHLEYTVDLKKLAEFDHRRPRYPAARSTMGESAAAQAQRLINAGQLTTSSQAVVAWHWCHLLAFSFLPTRRAQARRNLICGTSAFNGQMACIEGAVKTFIYKFCRPLSLRVTASYLADTHFGLRLRYQIFDKRSRESHTEYYDPYTTAKGDFSDYLVVYERLLARFEGVRPRTERRLVKEKLTLDVPS